MLLDFTWKGGDWSYALEDDLPASLTVRDPNGNRVPLARIGPAEGRRTLGVRIAADGNSRAEFSYLIGVSSTWAEQIRTGHLPRHLAWQAFLSTLIPRLKYPLVATTLSRRQCEAILSPALNASLSASGILPTFPRTMVHAPLAQRGLGVPHLYTAQGISHIAQILQHAHVSDCLTGRLIRISVEHHKLELGLPGGLFSHSFRHFRCLATHSWIKSTWQFLWEHNMSIHETTPDLPLRRVNDHFLMPSFFTAGYRGRDLARLNQCRLFLHAVTLADLTLGCGTRISPMAWSGVGPSHFERHYNWPHQGRPSDSVWSTWRHALSRAFGVHPNRLTLGTPSLRHWLDSNHLWDWFLCGSEARLYHRTSDGWVYHSRLPGRASRQSASRYSPTPCPTNNPPPPLELLRTTIAESPGRLISTGSADTLIPASTPAPLSLQAHVVALPPGAQWSVAGYFSADEGAQVAQAITAGLCRAVSDGSYKSGFGTSAWIFQGPGSSDHVQGCNVVPGSPADQSAFRSELSGLYAIAVMTKCLCDQYCITAGSIEVGCDGQEALYRCFSPDFRPSPSHAHYDLIVATRRMLACCPVLWKSRHIKGHQDADPEAVLDSWAQLNVDMDRAAKAHWESRHALSDIPVQFAVYLEPWSLWINGTKQCQRLSPSVVAHIHGTEGKHWWRERRANNPEPSLVDWDAVGEAMKNSSIPRRHWVAKHTSGFCSVGVMMHRRKMWPTPGCPRCQQSETAKHVWACRSAAADARWTAALSRLRHWLNAVETLPGIRDAICAGLSAWRHQSPPS